MSKKKDIERNRQTEIQRKKDKSKRQRELIQRMKEKVEHRDRKGVIETA